MSSKETDSLPKLNSDQHLDGSPEQSQSASELGSPMEESITDEQPAPAASSVDKKKAALQKRQYLIMEVIETEKSYIEDLEKIVCGYMKEMKEMEQLPEDLQGKDRIVFGNIEQIYEWHRETFQVELQKSLENFDNLAEAFIRYERRLYMYVKYCENKPKADFVVSEFLDTLFEDIRVKLGHKHNLPDLLITPVQRIQRYQLLLKDIIKQTKKTEEDTTQLDKALQVMCKVPKEANDMMEIGRLQGFSGKVTAQGKLLHQDTLQVSESIDGERGKFKERRVFLFDQIFILSDMTERRKGNISNATYIYKNSVKVNKMGMTEHPDELQFVLEDKTVNSDLKLYVMCQTDESYQLWTSKLNDLMDMQKNMLYALQSPIAYQEGGSQGGASNKKKHAHASTAPLPVSGGKSKKKEGEKGKKSILDGIKSTFRKKGQGSDEGQGMAKDRRPSPDIMRPISDPLPHSVNRKFSTMIQPLFLREISDQEAYVGGRVNFECTIQGKPVPDVEWLSPNDSVIQPSDKFELSQDGNRISLSIKSLRSFDAGSYTVRANNEMGSSSSKAKLNVVDNPRAPKTPTIVHIKGTSVLLQWESPQSGDIMSYTVQYQHIKDGIWHTAILRTPNKDAYVHHLVPGAQYSFRICCADAVETCSDESTPTTIEKDAVADSKLREIEHKEEVRWKTTFGLDYIQMNTVARGQFAVVRMCQHKESGRKFAAKRVSKKRSACTVAQEFHLLSTLSHENIVKVSDLYETESYFVMVLELLRCSLCEHLCKMAAVTESDVSVFMGQLCNALMYLHSFEIGHLDLKPEHLMIQNCALKVIDFGEAETLTSDHVVDIGDDWEFTAPEIMNGKPVSTSADIWSIGTILAVLLNGISLFFDDDPNQMKIKIRGGYINENHLDGVSPEAASLIRSCLNVDPSARPSAKQLKGHKWMTAGVPRKIDNAQLIEFTTRRKAIQN